MLRGRRAVPTVVVAALLLAGCTRDEPQPSPGPQVTESAEPTPTPSPTHINEPIAPPAPPAALERADEIGAATAAEYFASLYSYTIQSADLTTWDRMSAANCEFCQGVRQDVLAAASAGESYTGGVITLTDLRVLSRDEVIGGFPVEAKFEQTPEIRLSPDGTVLSSTAADRGAVRIDTLHEGDTWKILAVVVRDE